MGKKVKMSNITKHRKSIWVYQDTHASFLDVQSVLAEHLGVKPNTDYVMNYLCSLFGKDQKNKQTDDITRDIISYQLEEKP